MFVTILFLLLPWTEAYTEDKVFALVEENRSFWDEILKDRLIKNKNLLYASFVAYKDRLNELSIESFQECINTNSSNEVLRGIANYYIGKNHFLMGNYQEAISQFSSIKGIDLSHLNYIKLAALLNSAITYYQLNEIEKCREYLQTVINEDNTGKYKKKAMAILSQLN